MERNRWETAIRCLEIALHPNTRDDEVIAAVNGFRRTTNGAPLSEIRAALAGDASSTELDRVSRENLALRRRAAEAEARVNDVEQRARERETEHSAAERRAAAAERELADFRAAYGRILDRVNQDNAELRRALEQPGPENGAQRREATAPFRKFLAAAQRGSDRPGTPPDPGLQAAAPISAPNPRRPWMA